MFLYKFSLEILIVKFTKILIVYYMFETKKHTSSIAAWFVTFLYFRYSLFILSLTTKKQ